MRLIKFLTLLMFVILLSTTFVHAKKSIRDPNFNLNDNLEKDLHKYNNLNKDQYNSFKNGKELKQDHGFKIDDLDIDSTLINYWRDGQSMYFELNMSQDYMVWMDSGVKHKPISYRKFSDTYIVQFINLENWELHVGKHSDVWTDPATTKNGLIFYNGTIQSSVAVDYASTGPQQYNGTLVNGVTSSWDGTSRNFALLAASSQIIRNQDAPTNTWPFAISAWVKMPAKGAVEAIVGIYDKDANQKQLYIGMDATGIPQCNVQTGSGTRIAQGTTQIDDNNWHHIWCNFQQSNRTLFIDGVPEATNTVSEATIPGIDRFSVGAIDDLGASNYWTGDITGITLWNSTKNSTFVSFINSSGRAYRYNITQPPDVKVNSINLTNQPIFWNTFNTTCSANVTNAATTYYQWIRNKVLIFNTTNIITLNKTYYNISDNITCRVVAYNGTDSAQDNISITVSPPILEHLSMVSLNSDWPRDLYCNYSVLQGNVTQADWIINNNVVKSDNNYFNKSDFLTTYAGQDIYCRLTVNVTEQNYSRINITNNLTIGYTINITAIEALTSSNIENFTITTPNYNDTAVGESLLIYGFNGTETICFSKTGFASDCKDLTFSVNTSYEFTIYVANSILFTIRDAETHFLINQTVDIDIVSININDTSYNLSTDNGTKFVDLILPNSYIIYFASENYSSTQYSLNLQSNTFNTVDVYMYKTSVSKSITYSVVSEIGDKLSGAKVVALQFFSNSWNEVAQCLTNDAGTCKLDLKENDFYHYYVFYQDDVTPKFTSTIAERLDYTNDARTPFVLDLSENELFEYSVYDNVTIINFSYFNVSNNYTFRLQATYSQDVDNVCLSLHEFDPITPLVLQTTCLNGSGNIVFINRILGNKTYHAYASSIVSNTTFNIQRITINLANNIKIFGKFGIVITFFMVLTAICIGLALKQWNFVLFGTVGALFISNLMGMISVNYINLLILLVIAIILSIRKRETGT